MTTSIALEKLKDALDDFGRGLDVVGHSGAQEFFDTADAIRIAERSGPAEGRRAAWDHVIRLVDNCDIENNPEVAIDFLPLVVAVLQEHADDPTHQAEAAEAVDSFMKHAGRA